MAEEQDRQITFEKAMEELEGIVEKLEEGDVPLEKAIEMYQEGMNLSKVCHDKLVRVEKQMDQMMSEDGEIELLKVKEEEE
ncbi:exodeoxyribonuclease VII small subunit [Thalassorhabdus alkalitolerans]|uniref:Exodeoxyribonuclease 7 small subunit n=1 Tax=Thalassorhabdus alkalitolerans TaxID=2282697 RepID=A0ABW0YLI6_9BACI|nr:exodeoxyribonuclease VII small subunit [Thalassobacillus sp. C254]